jgi:hypothetical protein
MNKLTETVENQEKRIQKLEYEVAYLRGIIMGLLDSR